jgi:diaminopimelate decarboxylase
VTRPAERLGAGPWWARPGLEVRGGRLSVAGRDGEELARWHGTPLYAYDLLRVEENVRALQTALGSTGVPSRVRLALKAQRAPEVLAFVRGLGPPGSPQGVGIDACSPGEVLHALAHGWQPEEISYTGTNVSERDLDVILPHPIHLNVDLLSQLERLGRRAPGRRVGIRVNPRQGAGWASGRRYSGERPGKFGIYEERLDEVMALARRHDLAIDTVHFHVGDGFLDDGLPALRVAVGTVAEMARRLMEAGFPIAEVNAGGGLGVPQRPEDRPLDLDAYAEILAEQLGPLGVTIACEPGDFLTKECGIMLAEVVTVEDRSGATFVGLDAGFTVMPEHFIYGAPVEVVVCTAADAPPSQVVTVSGNINEGNDLFAEEVSLPAIQEGDILAMLGVGSYNQVMAMEHCLRPLPGAVFFTDRAQPSSRHS